MFAGAEKEPLARLSFQYPFEQNRIHHPSKSNAAINGDDGHAIAMRIAERGVAVDIDEFDLHRKARLKLPQNRERFLTTSTAGACVNRDAMRWALRRGATIPGLQE